MCHWTHSALFRYKISDFFSSLLGIMYGFLAIITNKSSSVFSASPRVVRGEIVATAQESSDESNLNTRIARIENGFLPPVTIKGQPVHTMKIADRMKFYRVPGVSVAFFDHGQIIWTRTYGFADVEGKEPVTTETAFQAASISKPISALAALRLVQDGKLGLDEEVNSKLRSWKVPENEFTVEQKVTLRGILSHSAGLTVHGFPGYDAGETVPTVVQILNGEKPANTPPVRVNAIPGTIWRYSGGGYVLLQQLLTDITGKPYPRILQDLVLTPAGMAHSTYEQPLPNNLSSTAATPYRASGEAVRGGWHTYPEMAAAGLWTTPSDLAHLAIEVQNEYAGRSSRILSQEMMRQMLTRQKENYGLGFELGPPDHAMRFGHVGSNEGFRCVLESYIESSQGFVIMTNSDNGDQFASEYLGAIAKEYNWPDFHPHERTLAKIDPGLRLTYGGTYEAPGLGNVTVTAKGAKLYLQVNAFGSAPLELLPESDTSFFSLSSNITLPFVFKKDEKGAVAKLSIILGDQTFEANKVK
jgi:CubicO group peptidase (beta-lactamase class C family)